MTLHSEEKREVELKRVRKTANECWNAGRFGEYLNILSPYREYLKEPELLRLQLARKKMIEMNQ